MRNAKRFQDTSTTTDIKKRKLVKLSSSNCTNENAIINNKISFVQLNVHGCMTATEQLNNYLINKKIDFALLQEPYVEKQDNGLNRVAKKQSNDNREKTPPPPPSQTPLSKYRLGYLSNCFDIFCSHDYESNYANSDSKTEYNRCRQKTAIIFSNININKILFTPTLLDTFCDQNTT